MNGKTDAINLSLSCLWKIKSGLHSGEKNTSTIDINLKEHNLDIHQIIFNTEINNSIVVLNCFTFSEEDTLDLNCKIDFTILDNCNKTFKKFDLCHVMPHSVFESSTRKGRVSFEKNLISDNISFLQRSGYVFYVQCDIWIGKSKYLEILLEKTQIGNEVEQYADGMTDFENLLKSNKFYDVKIITADGKELYAHKAVLAARSPVFSAFFENEMKEKLENIIEIADIDSYIVEGGLKYIYSNKFDELSEISGELMYFADKYDIKGLRVQCENAVSKNLNVENAIQILILADRLSCTELKTRTISFIKGNIKKIVKTDDFKNLKILYSHLLEEIIFKLSE